MTCRGNIQDILLIPDLVYQLCFALIRQRKMSDLGCTIILSWYMTVLETGNMLFRVLIMKALILYLAGLQLISAVVNLTISIPCFENFEISMLYMDAPMLHVFSPDIHVSIF